MEMSLEAVVHSGNTDSCLLVLSDDYPHFRNDQSFYDSSLHIEFAAVLRQDIPASGDVWDKSTRDAYEKAISYVGSIQQSINHKEVEHVLCRRVMLFTLFVPARFADFVYERRPRALVILAHFFAAMSQVTGVWWLGAGEDDREQTARREVNSINAVLPTEWRELMAWPMNMVRRSQAGTAHTLLAD
jgi:hypothetical protein